LISVIIVLVLGYIFDLQILLRNQSELTLSQHDISLQMSAHLQQKTYRPVLPDSIALRELLMIAEDSEVGVLAAVRHPFGQFGLAQDEYYQIVFEATDVGLVRFLANTANFKGRYAIKNFVISAAAGRMIHAEMLLRLRAGKAGYVTAKQISSHGVTPFCHDGNVVARSQFQNESTYFTLKSLRLLGIVHQHNHLSAIIVFPNGVTTNVTVNAMLGSEGGVISDIGKNNITVTMPDKTQENLSFHS
jgi:hypothetical protein